MAGVDTTVGGVGDEQNNRRGPFQAIGHGALVAADAAQRITTEFDPSSDLLKLFLRAVEVLDKTVLKGVLRTLYPFVHAARDITGFVSGRNIVGKVWILASGKAGWENPMGRQGRIPTQDQATRNIFAIGKNAAFAASDIGSTLKWLVAIGVVSDIFARVKIHIEVLGKCLTFGILTTVGAVGGIVGSTFAIAEDVRQILWGGMRTSKALDIGYRASIIAGIILTNYVAATGAVAFGLAFLGVGCIFSLAKFLVDEQAREPLGEIRVGRPLPDVAAAPVPVPVHT